MLRWVAVGLVVLYHVRFVLFASYTDLHGNNLLVKLFYFITSFGHEAFVAYMLLSGVLLGGQYYRRWCSQGGHAWRAVGKRMLWFYMLLVPALAVGGMLDFLGSHALARAGVYALFDQFSPCLTFRAFASNLFMVQRFVVPGLGSNSMLYLLAYEGWALLTLVAFLAFGRRELGELVAACIAAVGVVLAPEFTGYLLIWLIGFALAARPELPRVSRRLAVLLFLCTLVAARLGGAKLGVLPDRFIPLARMLLDVQFGCGAAVLLLAFSRESAARPFWRRAAWRLSRRFTGAHTAILATHFPFMMFMAAAANIRLRLPIAGQPDWRSFLAFACLVLGIYAYALVFARFAFWASRITWQGVLRSPGLLQRQGK